jgi:hypothetical protein
MNNNSCRRVATINNPTVVLVSSFLPDSILFCLDSYISHSFRIDVDPVRHCSTESVSALTYTLSYTLLCSFVRGYYLIIQFTITQLSLLVPSFNTIRDPAQPPEPPRPARTQKSTHDATPKS